MIGITLQIIWGSNKEDCEKYFKSLFNENPRWKLYPSSFTRRTMNGELTVMIVYEFNVP